MNSRRLYVSMLVTLDGYIAGPDGNLDWFVDQSPSFARYCDEMIDSVDTAIYGRKSYEDMVAYWPTATGPFADKMNVLKKVVLSRTLTRPAWNNTEITDDVDRIRQLKKSPGKAMVAWAGAGLVKTLTELDLVDEYRLIVNPVILGSGTRLFDGVSHRKLKLVRTMQLGDELAVLCHEPVRS
ncbi:MAG: dihydrofolate reductase family protein [Archangium sp.]